MTMTSAAEIEARREREAEDPTAKIMRMQIDGEVEVKRAVVGQIDRLVAAEEATHAIAGGQQH
jgi:hypothetical protein